MRETDGLLTDGWRVLRPGGWLVVELDCRRAGSVAARAGALGWQGVRTINDLFGRERFLLARRSEP
jgi:methylase of polypeptide subunit release factors